MKKTIQILLVIILIAVLSLIIIFVFNPLELRTKIIGGVINSYLSNTIENYTPIDNSTSTQSDASNTITQPNDKHPLLNETQEKTLESFGVNIEQLPTSITPGMETCFVEKLGETRATEIVKGATPSAMEFFKAKECLGK